MAPELFTGAMNSGEINTLEDWFEDKIKTGKARFIEYSGSVNIWEMDNEIVLVRGSELPRINWKKPTRRITRFIFGEKIAEELKSLGFKPSESGHFQIKYK